VHAAETRCQLEAGKQVAGKKRLGEPNRAFPRGTAKSDSRKIDFKSGVLVQISGGNVLMLRLRLNAKPRGRFPGGLRPWRLGRLGEVHLDSLALKGLTR